MNEKTKKALADFKAAGLDVSSLERQIMIDPLADRQADSLIGGGILRQSDYSRYMNDLRQKEQKMQQNVQNLATLHDAQNSGVELPQQALDAIKTMEDALIATGEFDEESVKKLSYHGSVPLQKMIQDRNTNNNNNNPNNNTNNNVDLGQSLFQPQQQQTFDPNQFVDVNTLRSAMSNLAYGDIATTMEINARIDEVRELGIKVDRAGIKKLQENLKKHFEGGGSLDTAFEETFEVSKAVEAKNQQLFENRVKDEADKRVAEALKEAGVPQIKKSNFGRHVIFDRNKRSNPANIPASEGNNQVDGENNNSTLNREVPKDKEGNIEYYKLRGDRSSRMQNASVTMEKVMEHYANDPTYVE